MRTYFHRSFGSFGLLAALLFLQCGCALQTGTITRSPSARFALLGDTNNVTVLIDQAPVRLNKGRPPSATTNPGKHRVQVLRSGRIIIDREVLLTDDQTFEITLP